MCILMMIQKYVRHLLNNLRSCVTLLILAISKFMLLIKLTMVWGRKVGLYLCRRKDVFQRSASSFSLMAVFLFCFTFFGCFYSLKLKVIQLFHHAEIYFLI